MASPAEVAELLRGYSVEVTPRSRSAIEACRGHLTAGTAVYIAFVPGETHDAVVTTAARLRAAGFLPVPHLTARGIAGPTQLDDFLGRLAGEAGVTRALVIAGDLDRPTGPYRSSLELLRTAVPATRRAAHRARLLSGSPPPDRRRGARAGAAREARAGA